MKTKKILLILLFQLLVIVAQAQTNNDTTLDLLTSTVWEHGKPIYGDYSQIVFTKKTMTEWYKNQYDQFVKDDCSMKYYLAEEEDKTFDKTKIGKVKNGQYIMAINPHGGFICYRILEISREKLTIVSIRLQGKMNTQNIPCTYTPVKK